MSDDKQFSFIDYDINEWIKSIDKEKGLCTKRFRADFVVKDLCKMNVNDIISIDKKEYIITIKGKKCYGNECELFNENKKTCKLAGGVAFGKFKKAKR